MRPEIRANLVFLERSGDKRYLTRELATIPRVGERLCIADPGNEELLFKVQTIVHYVSENGHVVQIYLSNAEKL